MSGLTQRKLIPQVPSMIGEDFSYYLHEAPGAYLHFGSSDPEKGICAVLHSTTYRMDEDVLNAALETYLACIFTANE